MDLGAFLADDSLGSWADGDVDFSSVGVPSSTAAPISTAYSRGEGFSASEPRRERMEYPIPDAPPYKARVGNLPYDANEASLTRFFEDRLQAHDIVEEVKLPMDQMTGRPKGFAFVTFAKREALEEALQLTMSEFTGRKIFVNVAAPQKADVFDNDWRSSRTGPMGGKDRFENDVELDWGAARSGGPLRGDRDRGDRERRPRREEADLDWGSARNTFEQPKGERNDKFGDRGERFGERGERRERPKREEVELDWNSARSNAPLSTRERPVREFREREPREPKKDDLDWSSARGSGLRRERREDRSERKEEKEFDWKRGQALPPKAPRAAKTAKPEPKEQFRAQKSVYDVLALDDEDDEDATLEKDVAALSVDK